MVLHTLRCGGAVSGERLEAALAAIITGDVEAVLLQLAVQGLVTHDSGPWGGWRLTETGRAADATMIATELELVGARADVEPAYADFLDLNPRVLDVCSAWQVRSWEDPMVLNDHTDGEYDEAVLDRLSELDTDAQEIGRALAGSLARFSPYGPRLTDALTRARRGETEYVTESLDSYHTVWFQLHEDLLVTLGIEREA